MTKAGKSQSARATAHDWDALSRIVEAEREQALAMGLDFDELYVHAIQEALVGRDTAALLEMLDQRRLLHPELLPALADVIRSQRDRARGAGKKLTRHQDRMIRHLFDRIGPHLHPEGHPKATIKWLASAFETGPKTIERSLRETETK